VVLYIGKYLGAERLLTRESTFSHKDDIQIFLECQLLFCHKENVVSSNFNFFLSTSIYDLNTTVNSRLHNILWLYSNILCKSYFKEMWK
jgi:hypothetical protein